MDFCGYFSPPLSTGGWESGWVRGQRDRVERVGTDLFLLNSSRFNQQIIDLIKWHPLLGQEPARGMRISQAKIKICSRAHTRKNTFAHFSINVTKHTHTYTHSRPHTTPLSACSPPGQATAKQKRSSRSPATKSKYRQRWKDKTQGAELQRKTNSVERADKRRQKLPNQNKPSLHTTSSSFLQ